MEPVNVPRTAITHIEPPDCIHEAGLVSKLTAACIYVSLLLSINSVFCEKSLREDTRDKAARCTLMKKN